MTYGSIELALVELLMLYSLVAIPVVHAGVFSFFFNTPVVAAPEDVSYAQDLNPQVVPLLKAAVHVDPNPAKGGGDILIEEGALVPAGDISGKDVKVNSKTQNGEISLYTVREGDTLSQIAEMFDISAKTILWANNLTNIDKIRPGDELVILPITGVRHVVKSGDTLKSIAAKYKGDIDDILAYNQMDSSDELSVGDTIVIPDGTVAAPAPTRSSSGARVAVTGGGSAGFSHPIPGAIRSQGIHGYNGVDFAAAVGTPIYAAASGEVIVSRSSGWNGGYGLYVVVKHANGTQTLYAHLSRTAVAAGNSVAQGQVIGYVGNTGRSTGPHLHFEVRGARNPF